MTNEFVFISMENKSLIIKNISWVLRQKVMSSFLHWCQVLLVEYKALFYLEQRCYAVIINQFVLYVFNS